MYNEDRKQKFLDHCGTKGAARQWGVDMFNSVMHMEEELGKDLAALNADETGQAIATSDVISSNTLSGRIPFVVRYKNWCAEQGFETITMSTGDIKVDVSDNIRDTMVSSPKALTKALNRSFKENSEKDSKCIYKAFLWMAFAGMYDIDASMVRTGDIDFKECTIRYNNRIYYFPREGRRDIKHATELDSFIRIVNGQPRTFRRDDGDKVLRGRKLKREISDKQYVMKTLRTSTAAGFALGGYRGMSFARIRKSGIFYEMFKREINGVPPSFYVVGCDDYEHEGKEATRGQTKQKILRRIILSYEKDYEAWKRAFAEDLKQDFGIDKIPVAFEV